MKGGTAMDPQELLAKISELTKEIEKLPRGYISQKAINGKVYYYHQWSENGQKKSRYLKDDELAALSVEISRRLLICSMAMEHLATLKILLQPLLQIQNK